MSLAMEKTNDRFVLFPIKHRELWSLYKKSVASFWVPEEIDLTQDLVDWDKLNQGEKHFISYVLAFFAASDGLVGENLAQRFYNDIVFPEARAFYGFQLAIEGIHAETYSLLIDTYIKDNQEKERLFKAIDTVEVVGKKANWAMKWLQSPNSFEERLVAFAVVEGIFFSSSFCSIYWLKKRRLMPGLGFSNELISRDEGLHTDFACVLYNMTDERLTQTRVQEIVDEAVQIECEFATQAIPVELIGMNNKMMVQYIKFVADKLLINLGYKKMYLDKNPFDFMEMISLQNKSNFFEKRVAEYRKTGVGNSVKENTIAFDAEF